MADDSKDGIRMLKRLALALALLLGQAFSAWGDFNEGRAAFDRGDYVAAYNELLPLARKGHPEAQADLGTLYLAGNGVAQNFSEAIKWYRAAASQGFAPAQWALGTVYYKGWGVAQDFGEAHRLYLLAARQNDFLAQYSLGRMYALGEGVARDGEIAAYWFRKSAERGLVSAQSAIAFMYYDGTGVPQDYVEAAHWARRAAEQGDFEAQLLLAELYYLGRGVPQDYIQAHVWSNIAASVLRPGERRDIVIRLRDSLALLLTPEQLARAQHLAQAWQPHPELRNMPRRLIAPLVQ